MERAGKQVEQRLGEIDVRDGEPAGRGENEGDRAEARLPPSRARAVLRDGR
jgi:hypothetical protein